MNTVLVDELVEPSWRLGPAPADYAIARVRAVLPDAVRDDAHVVVRDGCIAEIGTGPVRDRHVIDGAGLLLIPGIVDVHCDALENERLPRPQAPVPGEFAIGSLEGRLVGAGVTTIFHGIRFQHQSFRGSPRESNEAIGTCALVDQTRSYRVDHRVLHRMDVLSEEGAQVLAHRLDELPEHGVAPLVSHEDHTPGQGQYVDPQNMIRFSVEKDGASLEEAHRIIERLMTESEEKDHVRKANLAWLGGLAAAGRIRLAGHDPDTTEVVADLAGRAAVAAEFPTTLEAALAARERDLLIIAGAPNLLRGASHSGNVSARELVTHGLADALASDYLPAALLGSVWQAVGAGLVDLPHGVSLITAGPAAVGGLTDRGRLAEGLRADFALVDDRFDWPRPVTTLFAGGRTDDSGRG